MGMRKLVMLGLLSLAGCELDPTVAELPPEPVRLELPYFSATGGVCEPDKPGPSLAQARVDSTAWTPSRPHFDDRLAEIARQVPGGYGGRFREDGVVTIYLVHPELLDEAVAVLSQLGEGVGLQPRVKKGRWDFAQLYDWYRYLQIRGVWGIDGLSWSDIQESANRLHYGVTLEGLVPFVALLGTLQVPCELLVMFVGPSDFVIGE